LSKVEHNINKCVIIEKILHSYVVINVKGVMTIMQYDEYIGKMVQLTYSDLDGELVCAVGHILYTLKNRAFVFETYKEGRQLIVYNRHVLDIRETGAPSAHIDPEIAPDHFA